MSLYIISKESIDFICKSVLIFIFNPIYISYYFNHRQICWIKNKIKSIGSLEITLGFGYKNEVSPWMGRYASL